mgnify:CR=1 FL=1
MKNSLGKPNALDIFVQRPLLAVVMSLTLVLLGLRAAVEMPVLEFPEIETVDYRDKAAGMIGATATVEQDER